MGANTSALLAEELEQISSESNLSHVQVKRLYERFQRLDRNQSGTLEVTELLMVPELAMNPLHPRLLSIFENVNFRQFVNIIGAFSLSGDPNQKADFAFRIYDVDGDGFISCSDLEKVLRMLVGEYLTEDTITELATKVVADADKDKDGSISRDEFTSATSLHQMAKELTVNF